MFAVIYRGYIKPENEIAYQQYWSTVANYFVAYRGALGSCLHKTDEGYWLAYSRWPDKATRDASWPGNDAPAAELPDIVKQAIIGIQQCIDQEQKFPEICMEVKEDLLISN